MKPSVIEIIILIAVSIPGVLLTYYFNNKRGWGPVKSSALFSLLVGILIKILPITASAYLSLKIPLVFFGASFVGMVSDKIIKSYVTLAACGFFFVVIYLSISSVFTGFGGGLGTTACVSVLAGLGLDVLIIFGQKAYKKLKQSSWASRFNLFYKPRR